jgi:hypothetical protein
VTLMTTDDLEALLRAWGQAYGTAPAPERKPERRAPASHTIAVRMQFAPGKRVATIKQRTNMDRGGHARRRLMARASGIKGMRIVPADFVDAIPCRETRSGGGGVESRAVPVELQRVERHALELMRINRLRGLCLRFEYCTLGPHSVKAAAVAEVLGQEVKLKRFRDELERAEIFMHARLSA